MQRLLRTVPVAPVSTEGVARFTRSLRAALDGSGPAVSADSAPPDGELHVPESVALVVRTSGSSGDPRHVMLDADALVASAHATHERLGGPGRWVLALPLQHIAGLQVVIRSIVAGTAPAVVGGPGFDPTTAAQALISARRPGTPLYASLVPTQLHRIVSAASGAVLPPALLPWADLDAILVGGAVTSPALLDRARAAGLRVVTTYGMTETAGGCVYDGIPLAGVRVRVDGTVLVAGPVLARGYLGRPDLDAAFEDRDGVRWLRTGDLGTLVDGVLHVHGRADDVIVTGGVKVAPATVERALSAVPGVAEVCVVGLPDEEWGQVVTAVVVPADRAAPPRVADLFDAVVPTLGPAAAPRRLVLVDAIAHRGPGKIDRAGALAQAADAAAPA